MKVEIILLIFLAGSGCLQMKNNPLEEKNITLTENQPFIPGGIFEQFSKKNNLNNEEITQFFQEKYGLKNEQAIFEFLPKKPTTFEEDRKKLYAGDSRELGEIPFESYTQPDFYPTFHPNGIRIWVEANGNAQPVLGIATTPAEQETTLDENVTEFNTYLFVNAAWGTTEFQAFSFQYTISPNAPIRMNATPRTLFLGPVFPRVTKEWAERVKFTGVIPLDTPPGEYTITIWAAAPEEKIPEDAPGKTYFRGGDILQPSNGIATLRVRI